MTKQQDTRGKVSVMLTKPGAKACGPFIAGKKYQVTPDEAKRLVDVKGFEILDKQEIEK